MPVIPCGYKAHDYTNNVGREKRPIFLIGERHIGYVNTRSLGRGLSPVHLYSESARLSGLPRLQ